MNEYFPLLLIGAIIGVISVIFIVAYAMIKDKKKVIGFDRYMKDSELVKRLLRYARPHIGSFILVLVLMLFSIAYDIVAPLLVGYIEEKQIPWCHVYGNHDHENAVDLAKQQEIYESYEYCISKDSAALVEPLSRA